MQLVDALGKARRVVCGEEFDTLHHVAEVAEHGVVGDCLKIKFKLEIEAKIDDRKKIQSFLASKQAFKCLCLAIVKKNKTTNHLVTVVGAKRKDCSWVIDPLKDGGYQQQNTLDFSDVYVLGINSISVRPIGAPLNTPWKSCRPCPGPSSV